MEQQFIGQILEGATYAELGDSDKKILRWALDCLVRTQLKLTETKLDLVIRCLCRHPFQDISTELVEALAQRYSGGAKAVRATMARYNSEI